MQTPIGSAVSSFFTTFLSEIFDFFSPSPLSIVMFFWMAWYSNFRLLLSTLVFLCPMKACTLFTLKQGRSSKPILPPKKDESMHSVIPCIIIFLWFSSILRIHFFQITIEPPQGLRANLLVAYQSKPINEDKFYNQKEGGGNGETRKTEFQRLLRIFSTPEFSSPIFNPRISNPKFQPWTFQTKKSSTLNILTMNFSKIKCSTTNFSPLNFQLWTINQKLFFHEFLTMNSLTMKYYILNFFLPWIFQPWTL